MKWAKIHPVIKVSNPFDPGSLKTEKGRKRETSSKLPLNFAN
jgi:hypothetical protein